MYEKKRHNENNSSFSMFYFKKETSKQVQSDSRKERIRVRKRG
jgi:hypothetical protein